MTRLISHPNFLYKKFDGVKAACISSVYQQRVSAACISENYPQIAGLKLIQDLERSYLAKEKTNDLNLLLFILLGTWT